MTDYLELYQSLEASLGQLGREIPLPMSGFARLHKKTMEDGELSRKVKELMALAISIVAGCEGCIAYHTHDAVQAGPGSIYAAHALEAVEQFLPEVPYHEIVCQEAAAG